MAIKIKSSESVSVFNGIRHLATREYDSSLVPKIVANKRAAAAAVDDFNESVKDRREHWRSLIDEGSTTEVECAPRFSEEVKGIGDLEVEVAISPFLRSEILAPGIRLNSEVIEVLEDLGVIVDG